MNLFPPDFFQTGLFGAAEALLSESSYNPPSEFDAGDASPVTWMVSQSSEAMKAFISVAISVLDASTTILKLGISLTHV